MSTTSIALVVLACVFGGAALGLLLRAVLPEHHLSTETKDVVKLAMGLVATTTALVLGLLVASAKGAYDMQKSQVTQMAAKFAFLDRVLANCGPETTEPRARLREGLERIIERIWPEEKSRRAQLEPFAPAGQALYDAIQKLAPQTDAQRSAKSLAMQLGIEIGQSYWLLFAQAGTAICKPLLVVVVLWLTLLFLSFGMFAPPNMTAITALLAAAVSVSAAIFLVLELDRPFGGLVSISSEPMRSALNHLGH